MMSDIQPEGFDILYEDGPCLVVNKPGGLLTQAPPHIDSLELRVKQFLKVRDEKPRRVYLGVPHRLDRPVSGLLAMAKHVRAARRIAEQFERRTVRKTYWALVEGRVSPESATWRDQVRKIPGEALAEIVDEDHPDGRSAVLHYRVLDQRDAISWLEIELETGRTHQIRLQAGSRGFPILGDALYGATTLFGPVTDDPRARWIALHARQIEFLHPMTKKPVCQTARLPQYWNLLVD